METICFYLQMVMLTNAQRKWLVHLKQPLRKSDRRVLLSKLRCFFESLSIRCKASLWLEEAFVGVLVVLFFRLADNFVVVEFLFAVGELLRELLKLLLLLLLLMILFFFFGARTASSLFVTFFSPVN